MDKCCIDIVYKRTIVICTYGVWELIKGSVVSKKTNQEIEMAYFKEFCRDYSIHSNEIVYRDRPDFILKLDKTIGVEITNFYLERGDAASSEQCQIPL